LAYVLGFLVGTYGICNMPDAVQPLAERTIALSEEHGFPLWLAGARLWLGWSRVELGDAESGLGEMHRGIDALEATGALPWAHFGHYLLAHVFAKTGELRKASELVDQTVAALSGTNERWYLAELYRLRGDLLLGCSEAPEAAEACYEQAIEIAERQGLGLWKLRAITALAALWHIQGKNIPAHARLDAFCNELDERMVGPDLERAKALLAATRH
jgi:predicted ATPase